MMKAAASASGRAAAVARSFTVPATASRPMSPPGNLSGCTTWASVVKAMRPDGASAAASSSRSSTGLAKAVTKTSLTRSRYSLPPLPWPSRTRPPDVSAQSSSSPR